MLNARKYIEAFRLSGNGFRGELAGHAGKRETVAAETLQVIDIVVEAIEIRGAIEGKDRKSVV